MSSSQVWAVSTEIQIISQSRNNSFKHFDHLPSLRFGVGSPVRLGLWSGCSFLLTADDQFFLMSEGQRTDLKTYYVKYSKPLHVKIFSQRSAFGGPQDILKDGTVLKILTEVTAGSRTEKSGRTSGILFNSYWPWPRLHALHLIRSLILRPPDSTPVTEKELGLNSQDLSSRAASVAYWPWPTTSSLSFSLFINTLRIIIPTLIPYITGLLWELNETVANVLLIYKKKFK